MSSTAPPPLAPTSHAPPRGIDHVVIAARDLARLAEAFARFGFFVGARNRHPWGTQNHIVQFDGSFVELIGVEPGFHLAPDGDPHLFSFSGFIGDFLRRREGGAMIALTSDNADADARAFKVMAIGDFEPFRFERRGRRADGSASRLALTLAFARAPAMPDIGFFSCQHHVPEDFWDAAFQRHANGVVGLRSIVIVAENPADHGQFLSHLTGVRAYAASSLGIGFDLAPPASQRLDVLTPRAFVQRFGAAALADDFAGPAIAACLFATRDIAALRALLTERGVEFIHGGDFIVIGPGASFGLALIFGPEH